MKKKRERVNQFSKPASSENKAKLPDYPMYPENQDIYIMSTEEKEIDPEDISKNKEHYIKDKIEKRNEKDFNGNAIGSDLDVPGSELDDEQEKIGNEDEENNYYSLGGDGHNNLDEDKGE